MMVNNATNINKTNNSLKPLNLKKTSVTSLFVVIIKIERRCPIFRNIIVKFNVNTNLSKINLKAIFMKQFNIIKINDGCLFKI
jgi:hypothetical protein